MDTNSRSPANTAPIPNADGENVPARVLSGAHAAIASLADAADGIVRKVSPVIDDVEALAHDAADRAAHAATPTTEWMAEHGERLLAGERKLVNDTRGFIASHPLQSLGMAIAAGFVLSRLIR